MRIKGWIDTSVQPPDTNGYSVSAVSVSFMNTPTSGSFRVRISEATMPNRDFGSIIAISLMLLGCLKAGYAQSGLPGLNPFDPSKMMFPTKMAMLKEGTPQQVQAVWSTLQGTQQKFSNGGAISGTVSQLFFTIRAGSTQTSGGYVTIPIEVDLKAPLTTVPGPHEQVWFQGIFSSLNADGTVVMTNAAVVPGPGAPQRKPYLDARVPPPPSGSSTSRDFVSQDDFQAGDCHIHTGARIEISAGNDGIDVHFTAQMSTDAYSIMGDVFHLSFEFYDRADHLVLTSPEVDFPQNSSMHRQFGNYDIDYRTTIGPVSQPQSTLQSIVSAGFHGAC